LLDAIYAAMPMFFACGAAFAIFRAY